MPWYAIDLNREYDKYLSMTKIWVWSMHNKNHNENLLIIKRKS